MREMSEKGQAILDNLPYYFHTADHSRQVIDAAARELQRLEDTLVAIRGQTFPQNANDDRRTLGIWEGMLGLPVEPTTASLGQRQSDLIAAWRSRFTYSGEDWNDAAAQIIGTTDYEHLENYPTDYDLTVRFPFYYAETQVDNGGGYTLPVATITVDSTVGFTSAGELLINGTELVTYTGVTATTFTGVAGGEGTVPNDATVTAGEYRAGRIEALLRAITPAHINLVVTYSGGFIVGVSIVGEEAI